MPTTGRAAHHGERADPGRPDQARDACGAELADYASAAAAADELVRTLPDLDAAQPLPARPWFQPGERRSARRVILHIVTETAQHSGHADIIRESLDGAKSMGSGRRRGGLTPHARPPPSGGRSR
jgi:hypothetical protein